MDTIISNNDYYTNETPVKENTYRESHTMRNRGRGFDNFWGYTDMHVEVIPDHHPKGIPVTQIDQPENYKNRFSLHKNSLYDSFIKELEDVATDKTVYYRKDENMIVSTYKVPACGFLVSKTKTKRLNVKYNILNTDVYVEYKVSTPGAYRRHVCDNYHFSMKPYRNTSYYRNKYNTKFQIMKESNDDYDPF